MFDIFTTISTNLFRTFVVKKFLSLFFQKDIENKRKEKILYFLFFFMTTGVHVIFHFPPVNIITNLVMLYMVTQVYDGRKRYWCQFWFMV